GRARWPGGRPSRERRAGSMTVAPGAPALRRLTASDHLVFAAMSAPTALVTGGAGFIGSTLVRLLIDRGYRVRIYDDLSSGTPEHLRGLDVELVLGDVRELEQLTRACDGCQTMFHLAAGAGVVDSIEDPIGNFDLNARGTLLALWAAKQAGVGRFVVSSSN